MERRANGARPGIDGLALDHCCRESAEAKILHATCAGESVRSGSVRRSQRLSDAPSV